MQTIIKTKVQLKALQTKAETLIQTLDKEVIVITGGKQHIDVKPGNAYELNVKDDNVLNKDFNSIAKKVGDDLEVLLSNNATVVFNGYFKICTSDLSCLVSLPAEGGVYHVVEGNFVTLSDGSKIVYSYGDEATLTSITSSQSSLFTDIFNEVYLADGFSLAGVGGALAAVGLLANAGTTNNTIIPTIAITSDANSLKAGQTAIITFTLSEVSTDFTAADVEVTGGRLSDFAPKAGEAKVYTATFIPTKNSTIAGEISVASDKFSDAAGNHNADGSDNSLSLTVDTILPTIAITSDANSLKAGQTAIITFTLSEVSTDFTAADVEVTGGRLSDFAPKAGEAKVYTATFTSTGTIASEISVASDKFTDTAGNNNVNNSVLFKSIVFFDTDISMLDLSVAGIKKIKIVLTGNALNTVNDKLVLGNAELALNDTNSDKFKIEVSGVKYEYSYDYNHITKTLFIFKNDGGNLLVADVEKIGGVIKLKNATDTLNDGERTATISYIDAFFNEGAFAIATIYVNTNDITVTITSNAGDIIKQGDIVTYTFVFSEDVDNFVKGDIVVAGGEIKGDLMATHNNKKIYKLTVIPKSHSTEDMIVTVTANSVQGVNSAIVETSALGQEVNTNDITVTITSNAGDIIKQGETVTYTFVFSEDVDNFVKGDIVVAGGEIKGDLMATHNNKKIYKLTVIPKSHSTEDMIVTVTANSVQGVNSAIVETAALGQEVNTNDITVTITSNAGDIIKQGETVTYTFVFSEDVDNFVKGDIVVAGGEIKGDLMATHNNKKIYKLTVIPKSHSTEDMIVTVTANSVQGVNGAIVETAASGQEVNTNDITVTITSNAGDIIKQGDIVTYTFVFSEDVDNFVKGDIVVAGGEIKGDLMATHNNKKIYKLTVIPKSHSTEDMIVTVTANSVQGVNGAIVETAASGQEVNTNDITVTITSNAGDIIKQGETVTYTFVFSEDVDNFVKGDIVVAGGEIKGDLMATHNNKKIYKLTVIPKSHSTEDMIVTVTANSVQGVNGAIVETAASGQEVNTNDITVTITSNAGDIIKQGEMVTYTFVFSEDVDNFVKGDIVVVGGEIKGDLIATHNNKKIYKLTVIPKSHSTEDMIVTVTANSVQGVNGAIVETAASGQEVNTNDITVTITSNAEGTTIEQNAIITYTFVFSEDVDNFVKGDIVVGGGEIKGDLMATHNNKKIYKLTVTPKLNITGEMIVIVAANSVQGVHNPDATFGKTIVSDQKVSLNAMASLQGDNGVDDDLFGAGISEYIAALGGNDILTGNAGNDILIGGRGTNTFKYTAITDGHDTIMDFKINEDKLDFSELFSGTDITFNLSRFIRVTDNNGSAPLGDIVLWIDVDGDKGIKKSGFISDITVTLREAGLPDRETTLDYLMDNHIILL